MRSVKVNRKRRTASPLAIPGSSRVTSSIGMARSQAMRFKFLISKSCAWHGSLQPSSQITLRLLSKQVEEVDANFLGSD